MSHKNIPDDYVKMERHICVVCAKSYDTGAILMSKTLTSIKNPHTGWGFCPEHKALKNQGFIALVECDPDKTREHTPAGAHRTGRIVHIKEEVARNLFNTNLGDKGLAFIEPGVLEKLAEIYERDTGEKLEH